MSQLQFITPIVNSLWQAKREEERLRHKAQQTGENEPSNSSQKRRSLSAGEQLESKPSHLYECGYE